VRQDLEDDPDAPGGPLPDDGRQHGDGDGGDPDDAAAPETGHRGQ
jgi:hypothetical protein